MVILEPKRLYAQDVMTFECGDKQITGSNDCGEGGSLAADVKITNNS